jgi:predicted nucleic acid-binding protein
VVKVMPAALCVDASVGVKWFLREEAGAAAAHELLERFAVGKVDIVVPELFFYEMGSALCTAVKHNRITLTTAVAALDEIERLSFTVVTLLGDMASAMMYSQRLGVSIYDASYLVAAESRQVPLLTCDHNLLQATRGRLNWVLGVDQARMS